jgi:hypothetical protein
MDDSSGASVSAAAAPSSSSQCYPDWVMLDPHNNLLESPKDTLDYSEPDDHFRSTNADAVTSNAKLIRVSFRAVPPPEVSRLWVRCARTRHSLPEKERCSSYYERESMVVAAYGNFILLSLGLMCGLPEFLVYTVGSVVGPPTLRLLPSLDTPELHHIGLVCDVDSTEFVAADLQILSGNTALNVFRSCSTECSWKAMDPPPRFRHKKGQGVDLYSWYTDEVVPCGDTLCYVDYHRGVLFLDVLSECPELRYVRLPAVKVHVTDPYTFQTFTSRRAHPERSLCATNGGRTIKFVEVVTTTVFTSRGRATASALFNINVWRLWRDDKDMTWEKESGMEDADLWALKGYGDLPRVAPTFPRVSLEEPNVIYLVLSSRRQVDEDETWVIAVDMSNKTLRSSFRYTKQVSESQAANCAFIPCKFSKDLQVPQTG